MNNYWWFYFVLTCLISWPVWGLGKLLLPENLRIITSVIGAFGPFVAAIIMQRRTGGKAGLRAWLKTTFNFRIRSSSSERYKFREKNKTLMYMKNKNCLLVFTILFSLCISCNRPNTSLKSTAEEKEMIEKTIRGCIGWAKDKNLSYLYNIIANDSDYLEVHPGPKVVKGFSEFRKAEEFWMSPDFRAVRYDVWDLKINISNSGDVAWWFCMLNDINTWKDEPASWENTRWTGVLEKRNGKWTVVQQHFSFAGE